MRILRLDLIRFGAFADTALDFSAASRERPGLHLIHGPNEAGKSTARRALRCALYGFSQRAEFDFVHDKKELLVGLTIEDAVDQPHRFVRRRGNKNTLLDAVDRSPISDGMLSRALAGAGSSEEFERAFAIGHEELRAGGEAMLDEENATDGGADISRLLFIAATGLSGIKQIERGFLETAEDLFKPRGKNQAINQGIAELKDLAKQQRDAEARADEYLALEDALRESRDRHESQKRQLTATGREQARLVRLQEAKPTLARLRQRMAEREELGDVPELGDGFTERRAQIQKTLEVVAGEIELLRKQNKRIGEQLAALVVTEDLLTSAATIDRLHGSLEVHRKARKDSERLRGEIAGIERDMRACLREIGRAADELDPHVDLITSPDAARIRKLASDRAGGAARLAQERTTANKLRERLDGIEGELKSLGEEVALEELRRAIRTANRAGDLDSAVEMLSRELREARTAQEQSQTELPGWSGTRDELRSLNLPDEATVDEFGRRFDRLQRRRDQLAERRSAAEAALDSARHEAATIRQDRDVPDEQTLQNARVRRELGWQEVRRELEGLAPGLDRDSFLKETGNALLPEAYEAAVHAADAVADRLRREAEVVGRLARCQADAIRHETELERISQSEIELRDELSDLERDWRERWPFLDGPPRSPAEMRAWSSRARNARDQIDTTTRLEIEYERLVENHAEFRRELIAAMRTLGVRGATADGPLAEILRVAELSLEQCQETNQTRASLMKDHAEASGDLTDAERRIEEIRGELETAGEDWSRLMSALNVPAGTSHESAIVVLEALEKVDGLRHGLAEKHERIEQMEQDRAAFAREVEAIVRELNGNAAPLAFEDALADIQRRLVDARKQATRREELRSRADEAAAQIEEKSGELAGWQAELHACCRQANCASPDELPAIEANAARAAQLDREIDEFREELLERGGGRPLEEFQRELDAADVDEISARLGQLDSEIARMSEQKDQAVRKTVELEQQLAGFGGGGKAADIAGEIASLKARIARNVEQYARARIAARLLREGRERYRKQSSSELLERASDLFARLTRGAFGRLQVDYGERDRPILLGVRSGGRGRVEPAGMSDGTRDQLYLALRVAWLHAWLDKHDPLPFVVDDLLIHFDDERAAAALEVLSELSERTQILFFTHHDHLRELARGCVPAENLHEHELRGAFALNVEANGQEI